MAIDADILEYLREEGVFTGQAFEQFVNDLIYEVLSQLPDGDDLDNDPIELEDAVKVKSWGAWDEKKWEKLTLTADEVHMARKAHAEWKKLQSNVIVEPGAKAESGVYYLPFFDGDVLIPREDRESTPVFGRKPSVEAWSDTLLQLHEDKIVWVKRDDEMKKLEAIPEIDEGLDLKLTATEDDIKALRFFMRKKKEWAAQADIATALSTFRSFDSDSSGKQPQVDFVVDDELFSPLSPFLFPRPRPPTPSQLFDASDLLAFDDDDTSTSRSFSRIQRPSIKMEDWNKLEHIHHLFSPHTGSEPTPSNSPNSIPHNMPQDMLWSSSQDPPLSASTSRFELVLVPRENLADPSFPDAIFTKQEVLLYRDRWKIGVNTLSPNSTSALRPSSPFLCPDMEIDSDDIDELESDTDYGVPVLAKDFARLSNHDLPGKLTPMLSSEPEPPEGDDLLLKLSLPTDSSPFDTVRYPSPTAHSTSPFLDVTLADFSSDSASLWAAQQANGLTTLSIELAWYSWEAPVDRDVWEAFGMEGGEEERGVRELADAAMEKKDISQKTLEEDSTIRVGIENEGKGGRFKWTTEMNFDDDDLLIPREPKNQFAQPCTHGFAERLPPDTNKRLFKASAEVDVEEPSVDGQLEEPLAQITEPTEGVHTTLEESQSPLPGGETCRVAEISHANVGFDFETFDSTNPNPALVLVPGSSVKGLIAAERTQDVAARPALPEGGSRPPSMPYELSGPPFQLGTKQGSLQKSIDLSIKDNNTSSLYAFLVTRGANTAPLELRKPGAMHLQPTASPSVIPSNAPSKPIPRPTSFSQPSFLNFQERYVQIRPQFKIIATTQLLQRREHFAALKDAGFSLVDRSSPNLIRDKYRILEPDLIVDGKTCVIFQPLLRIVNNVERSDELSPNAEFKRPEALLTTVTRLSKQFESIFLVLEEAPRGSAPSARGFSYTPPVLSALATLSQRLDTLSFEVQLALSTNPTESSAFTRQLVAFLHSAGPENYTEEGRPWLHEGLYPASFLSTKPSPVHLIVI
ncbi:hypothetical protein T439DRAFT_345723 [Meredithblackwellia eburnea MCA 4105]